MLRTMRRVKQLGYLLMDSVFTDHSANVRQVKERYDSLSEVRHYGEIADEGLYSEEEGVVLEFLKTHRGSARALVVGCGAGREAFALSQMGLTVTGIDLSPKMIEKANQLNSQKGTNLKFVNSSLQNFTAPVECFDFIFISSAIVEHIYGRAHRIEFYEKARRLLKKGGGMYVGPEIQRVRKGTPYFWASQFLRVRWSLKGHTWEPGDSARAFFGRHNQDLRLVFYHFYPSYEAFEAEVREAGLEVTSHHEGGYLLRQQ